MVVPVCVVRRATWSDIEYAHTCVHTGQDVRTCDANYCTLRTREILDGVGEYVREGGNFTGGTGEEEKRNTARGYPT